VILPEGTQTVGDGAFYGCAALTEAVIPDTVTEMGKGVFDGILVLGRIRINLKFMGVFSSSNSGTALASAVRGFLISNSRGEIGDAEKAEWKKYISRRTPKLFTHLSDVPEFYRFLTEKGTLDPSRVDKLLANTDNPECRAILLEYGNKRRKNNKNNEDTVGNKFTIN
jgi:hypothetical protein